MIILPAIDLLGRKAVRLLKGDYNQVTVYSDSPLEVAEKFKSLGATHIHMVDLDGAKYGTAPNMDIVAEVAEKTGLFIEIGGGIRSMETVKKYIDAGISRVILGTAAICDEDFLKEAVKAYGEKIAVGADVKDGKIAVKGWLEQSDVTLDEFFLKMQDLGVKNIICTDISRDGAMRGTNLELYRELSAKYSLDITASGGVSSIEDVKRLREMNLYGAIIGKAYYTGAVDLEEAIEVAR
ncbi:MAG: 1-(5-phosphoribosyl)-5-[(5-phosphoribosylamino)methylideneamino]imidazole-4-carboxamide isomerase [Ruminococcaceae bacterium]|jgi:phosphoribosylformimino-5-aminoimidazole carboxamide ribotide isomerase|nr:1-(5-phosphoribosyl)-5-[(5-phosphoribosylamino)methylideneamino]imidazole-4-carboxamide isomerase [Oscillospiraceae bacterium]MBD8962293.1 1-(5-phosphoribosyl)-5-[(5-phosphoribosylamino)methylideneamino]imidazole-4-carboxamide isomerase [Oscillospiraceae bacterium]